MKSLKTDPNLILKSGVIGVSGLGGIVLGYKGDNIIVMMIWIFFSFFEGGFFRKFTYMLIGSGTAAALIFPQAAKCIFSGSVKIVQKQYQSIRGKTTNDDEVRQTTIYIYCYY